MSQPGLGITNHILLLKVANDDVASFKNNNEWLKYHPNKAQIFAELDDIWEQLKDSYNGSFKNLVFGELPKDKKVLETLQTIKSRLAEIEWKVEV